ncbi:hypothetical protein [Paracidovorax cattleyae]|uniref:DUF4347 domain-containing protein n=1 Tax=Paracidovorax cattleyae TaxID=80868 RepID=A0A1H0KMA4_9BURK|nr:hypothetical protein [Paracidovorax cattleyae]AVS73439.1 hypothetical protein C8240_04710 [Paracidovorax cattleyae]MBF9264579.1 hypothetical protein [Paracidovorax cattleyae]SDO57059.1 hypothetical protein SAMN04489708_101285 [Paracidovorax cattleyae]
MSLAYWLREEPAEPVEEGRIQHGPGKGLPKLVFQSLDASKTIVKKIATVDRVRRKIILIQPSDKALYLSGLRERGVPGYVYIFAHARSNSLQGVTRQGIIVDLIHRSGIWHGQPIMIDACNAGADSDGISSSLAVALRTFVTAPTTTTWNYAMGGTAIGQGAFEKLPGVLAGLPFPDLFRPGRWRTWGPDGKPIAITRTSPRDGGELVKGPLADVLMKKP